MKAPVILFFYNRPNKLLRTLRQLKKSDIGNLYFFSDGPQNRKDLKKVDKCRDIATSLFPKAKLFQYKENAGFGYRIVENIKSVFEFEQKAIILEDDILFASGFIDTCNEYFLKFSRDDSIFCFKGYNHLINSKSSCYLKTNVFLPPWGWACTKKAFKNISDFSNDTYRNRFKFKQLKNVYKDSELQKYISNCEGNIESLSWDNHVFLSILFYNLNVLLPSKNLIKNIGYGTDASQTHDLNSIYYNNNISNTFNYKNRTIKDYSEFNESQTLAFFKDTCAKF